MDQLGVEEMERRHLVCGDPYSFQGDERDVIFLSMVAAPNLRIGPLTKVADERRFNVAASRAKNQMWLFHSVRSKDLSEKDLRGRLLDFFENVRPLQTAGIDRDELERKASQDNHSIVKPPTPFGSWFEVDVYLAIADQGFLAIPQYEAHGYRIDICIVGGTRKLAVECDGDYWHGPQQYADDLHRQGQLERCGWEFFRVRESAFYTDKDAALRSLWAMLEERGILPGADSIDPRSEKPDNGAFVKFDGDETDTVIG
jgi:hypothetical protein